MSRTPVITIAEVHNYLSWKYDPTEIEWAFDQYGIENGKAEMRRQLELAMESAERTYKMIKQLKANEKITAYELNNRDEREE